MIEAYTRDELDRSIEAAFRAGFGNALAEAGRRSAAVRPRA